MGGKVLIPSRGVGSDAEPTAMLLPPRARARPRRRGRPAHPPRSAPGHPLLLPRGLNPAGAGEEVPRCGQLHGHRLVPRVAGGRTCVCQQQVPGGNRGHRGELGPRAGARRGCACPGGDGETRLLWGVTCTPAALLVAACAGMGVWGDPGVLGQQAGDGVWGKRVAGSGLRAGSPTPCRRG